VIPASPTTLIALLRAVAYGWRQETIAASAREISELGQQLHERLRAMTTHFVTLQRSLDASVLAFNRAMGSLETRVLVSARKFQELGAARGDEIEAPGPVESAARVLAPPAADDEAG
jgi:DNA recombination protein RmuC